LLPSDTFNGCRISRKTRSY